MEFPFALIIGVVISLIVGLQKNSSQSWKKRAAQKNRHMQLDRDVQFTPPPPPPNGARQPYSPYAGQYAPPAGQYAPSAGQYAPSAGQGYTQPPAGQYAPQAQGYVPVSGNVTGSMAYDSSEGEAGYEGRGASMEGRSNTFEGRAGSVEGRSAYAEPRARSSVTHVVKPVTESAHYHQESSMTGAAPDCPPPAETRQADAYAINAGRRQGYRLELSRSGVVNGLIFSEVLNKPKALRR